jgi:NADPH:quinone reductase
MVAAKAVHMQAYGPPDVLIYGPAALPQLASLEVRVQTIAAAVNHTDLKIRAGAWPVRKTSPFPYVPGVEVVGTIIEKGTAVKDWFVGQTVITMMQGLGGVRAERPGAYAEFVTVDASAIALVPRTVDPLAIAALGLVGVTALGGLRRAGSLQGKRVLVTGAAGGVGSAAIAIARAMGASVAGIVARAEQAEHVGKLGADDVIVVEWGQLPKLAPESVDAVLDSVGGQLFGPCVSALREQGSLVLVGAVAGADVCFDAWQLIRPVSLTGYSTEELDGPGLRAAVESLSVWLETGAIRTPEYKTIALEHAAQAHQLLERGGISGRVLLIPQGAG